MMMPSRKPKGIDVAALKRQVAGRWPEILSALSGVSAEILDGKNHPCPRQGCGGGGPVPLHEPRRQRFMLLQPV